MKLGLISIGLARKLKMDVLPAAQDLKIKSLFPLCGINFFPILIDQVSEMPLIFVDFLITRILILLLNRI